jgi:hypothetical protein
MFSFSICFIISENSSKMFIVSSYFSGQRHDHLPQGNTKLQQETMETIAEMTAKN